MGLFSNVDWDEFFSYQTVKFLTIRERKLGIIHHILKILIFIYIVLYTIIYQQRYLLLEPPYGTIRATVQEPKTYEDFNEMPYCAQNQATYNSFTNQNCTFLRGTDLTYPPGQLNSIFISTRIKDTYTEYTGCQLPYYNGGPVPVLPTCPPPATNLATPRYFLASIEDYTVYMEHAIFGRQNEILVSNVDCDGKLLFRNGSSQSISFTDKSRTGDIVPLQTILNAADVSSLDAASGRGSSFRYDGAALVAVVEYENSVTDPKKFYYTYKFYLMPNQDVVNMQPSQATIQAGVSVQRNWYGVRIIFMVVGAIGAFDFPTLLTSLMSGLVLINVATVIVDLMLLHIMPAKKTYAKHKFDVAEGREDSGTFSPVQMSRPSSSINDSNTNKKPLLSDFS